MSRAILPLLILAVAGWLWWQRMLTRTAEMLDDDTDYSLQDPYAWSLLRERIPYRDTWDGLRSSTTEYRVL